MLTKPLATSTPAYQESTNSFITQLAVQDALRDLTALRNDPNWFISDVLDEQGQQYVDFVLEGGGMLGIALAGYVYGLETAGIRFLRLGGTSAGAIVAMLLASLKPRYEATGEELLTILAEKNFYDFVDGDEDARTFTKSLLGRATTHMGFGAWLRNRLDIATLIKDGSQVIDNFRNRQGLHPGEEFKKWLHDLLAAAQTPTIEALVARRRQKPNGGLKQRIWDEAGQLTIAEYDPKDLCRLAVVAADITTQTKAIFPEMAPLYWANWRQVSPAELVRASMSVPFFFEPYCIQNLPGSEAGASSRHWELWKAFGYEGAVPPAAVFMDGGIMSNFPIDLFHNSEQVPEAPTFGVKLGIDRIKPQATDTFLATVGSMFDATRTQYDFDFIQRNPDYHHLVHCLDVDKYNWLDFDMPEEDKKAMFAIGVRGALNFLTKFNWNNYKRLRRKKADYVRESREMDKQRQQENPMPQPAVSKVVIAEQEWPCVRPKYLQGPGTDYATNPAS